jgi:hypothetical protein
MVRLPGKALYWITVLLIASCIAKNEKKQPAREQTPVREQPRAAQPIPTPALQKATPAKPLNSTRLEESLQAGAIQPLGNEFVLLPARYNQALRPLDSLMASKLRKVGYPGQYYYGIRTEHGDTTLIATLEEDTEWKGIHLFSLNKGQAVSALLVAQTTESENSYKHTQTRFDSDSTLRVTTFRGAKDSDNYQIWDRDTTINTYWISPQGMIREQE